MTCNVFCLFLTNLFNGPWTVFNTHHLWKTTVSQSLTKLCKPFAFRFALYSHTVDLDIKYSTVWWSCNWKHCCREHYRNHITHTHHNTQYTANTYNNKHMHNVSGKFLHKVPSYRGNIQFLSRLLEVFIYLFIIYSTNWRSGFERISCREVLMKDAIELHYGSCKILYFIYMSFVNSTTLWKCNTKLPL